MRILIGLHFMVKLVYSTDGAMDGDTIGNDDGRINSLGAADGSTLNSNDVIIDSIL